MKKLLVVLLVLTVSLFVFAKKTEVEFWTLSLSPTFDDYINSIIDSFEQAHPDIQITWRDIPYGAATQKLTASIAAGQAPDVINLNTPWTYDMVGNEALLPLDNYIYNVERYRYWDNLWDATKIDGKSYAIPWYVSPQVMIYNREIFEDAGLDPDNPPKTWDEVLKDARTIKEMTGVYALEPDIKGHEDLISEGVPLVTKDGKKAAFNTQKAIDKLKWYQTLYNEDLMPRDLGGYNAAKQKYSAGQLAMWPVGISMLKHIEQNSPTIYEKTDVSIYPLGSAKLIKATPMNLAVPFNTKVPREAVEFMLWVTSGYWQVEFAKHATVLPSSKISINGDEYFIEKAKTDLLIKGEIVAAESMKYGAVYDSMHNVPADKYENFRRILNDYWTAAIKGEYTAEEALSKAEKECNDLLAY